MYYYVGGIALVLAMMVAVGGASGTGSAIARASVRNSKGQSSGQTPGLKQYQRSLFVPEVESVWPMSKQGFRVIASPSRCRAEREIGRLTPLDAAARIENDLARLIDASRYRRDHHSADGSEIIHDAAHV